MLNSALLDRALLMSIRRSQTSISNRFKSKEPIAAQFDEEYQSFVGNLTGNSALEKHLNFSQLALEWLQVNDNIINRHLGPRSLSPLPNVLDKPQPHFFEAVFATLLKLELLITFVPFIKSFSVGCLLGGSLSYGRFFNVRQAVEAQSIEQNSDIDLLLVLPSFEILNKVINDYSSIIPQKRKRISGTMEDLLYGLLPLANAYNEISNSEKINNDNIVISKKFMFNVPLTVGEIFHPGKEAHSFPLSIHVTDMNTFNVLTLADFDCSHINVYEPYRSGPVITDLRIDSPLKSVLTYSIMEGVLVPESASQTNTVSKDIEFGNTTSSLAICKIPAFFTWKGRYVSGLYQNLILPSFDIVLDDNNNTLLNACDHFRQRLVEIASKELFLHRDSDILLSNLHPRHIYFPTMVKDKLDKLLEHRITTNKSKIFESYSDQTKINIRKNFHDKYNHGPNLFEKITSIISRIVKPESTLLELGCGDGSLMSNILNETRLTKAVGIDLICQGSADFDANKLFVNGDLNDLSSLFFDYRKLFPKCFDIVLALHVLYHLKNVQGVLESSLNKMHKDSIFIATTNSNKSLANIHNILRDSFYRFDKRHISLNRYKKFSSENAQEIFRTYFKNVNIITYENDLCIDHPEDVTNYIASCFENYEIPTDDLTRKGLKKIIDEMVKDETINGIFYDRRIVTIIIGEKPILNNQF